MSQTFTESVIEEAALAWLEGLGYAVLHGSAIATGEWSADDPNYRDVGLDRRLRETVQPSSPAICGSRTLRNSLGWAGDGPGRRKLANSRHSY
jgi:hypothetical protein